MFIQIHVELPSSFVFFLANSGYKRKFTQQIFLLYSSNSICHPLSCISAVFAKVRLFLQFYAKRLPCSCTAFSQSLLVNIWIVRPRQAKRVKISAIFPSPSNTWITEPLLGCHPFFWRYLVLLTLLCSISHASSKFGQRQLARVFQPIGNGEIFWMNKNKNTVLFIPNTSPFLIGWNSPGNSS